MRRQVGSPTVAQYQIIIMSKNTMEDLPAAEVAPSIEVAQDKPNMDQPTTVEDSILPRPLYRSGSIEMGEIAVPDSTSTTEKFSIYTVRQKKMIIIAGSFAAFFSPVSSNIYFPALNTIAKDLHVSLAHINLTVTTYQVRMILCPPVHPTIAIPRVNSVLTIVQDYAGYCAHDRRRSLRRSRPTTSVLYLFHVLHCGQPGTCASRLIRCANGPATSPERW